MNTLVLTNIPSPYQIDLFRALESEKRLRFQVLFCSSSERDRSFSVPNNLGFKGKVLNGRHSQFLPKDWSLVAGLEKELESAKPLDLLVISGSYGMPAARIARNWATRNNIPWIFWGEDPWKKNSGKIANVVKSTYLKWFLKSADGAIGVGNKAKQSFSELMGEDCVYANLPYAPDLKPLLKPTEDVRLKAQLLRRQWKIADPIVVMFSGSLTHRKAPDMLMRSFSECSKREPRLRLLLAGDGPMREQLGDLANELEISAKTRLLGFVEGQTLHASYLSADIFVLPTRTHEGWGVVVQEALAAGLPVVASDRVGAAHDLLNQDAFGRMFYHDDISSLTDALSQLLEDQQFLATEMREVRKRHARNWSSATLAKSFSEFLRRQKLNTESR